MSKDNFDEKDSKARNAKRQKFAETRKSPGRENGKGLPRWQLTVVGLLGIAIITGVYLTFIRPNQMAKGPNPAGTAYTYITMTDIPTPQASNGVITLSLKEIRDKKLVWFTYGPSQIAVLAYISPSGQVVTAVSVCEPCRSVRFHIEGNEIVCNACGSRWTLEDLRGISGGCLDYPPDRLANQVQGDQVLIKEQDVLDWVPRV